VVLDKDGDHWDLSCVREREREVLHRIKKERNILYSIKNEEGYLHWSLLA
jgi:hypothetical protein